MTEDEAKMKWCPFSRTMGVEGETIMPAANRVFMFDGDNKLVFPHPEMCSCLASKCAAWRWDGEVVWSEMSKRWLAKDVPGGAKTNAAKGFCGLAGRPHA